MDANPDHPPQLATAEITPAQARVLARLAAGDSVREAGRRLGMGRTTVRGHLDRAARRLGTATDTHTVANAIRLGIIE